MPNVTGPKTQAREHFVEVWGQRLRVLVNTPGGPPSRTVLVLNGIGTRAEILDRFIAELDSGVETIRIDPPGIGGSPTARIPYLLPQVAWLVEGALRALGYDRVDVVGYSWGGLVAQQLALQARLRIDRLVLLASNTGVSSIPGSPQAMTMLMNPGLSTHVGADRAGEVFGGLARTRADEVMALLAPDLAVAGAGYYAQAAAAMTWSTLPGLWAISKPTLIISGDDDPLVPVANARVLAALIPKSQLHIYPGGHFDPLLEPGGIAARIARFLLEAPQG